MRHIAPWCILLTLFPHSVYSQCSDAGVCSIGSHRPAASHQIGVSYTYGRSSATDDLTFHSVALEGNFHLEQDTRFAVTLPWSTQSGPLGSASGLGDLILVLDHVLLRSMPGQLNVQVGGKLATGEVNGGNLPQSYQSGLGTNDLLLGLSYSYDSWNAALGYQYSGGRSENRQTRLKRGDDFLIRLGYNTSIAPVTAGLEVLAVKRLAESSVHEFTTQSGDMFISIPKSDQFQINILGRFSLPLEEGYSLQTLVAFPILKRDINVDGLTRALTLS
ncbi:MAG: hypothetical protein WEB62_10835, partial [Bacteroidota bacterium]